MFCRYIPLVRWWLFSGSSSCCETLVRLAFHTCVAHEYYKCLSWTVQALFVARLFFFYSPHFLHKRNSVEYPFSVQSTFLLFNTTIYKFVFVLKRIAKTFFGSVFVYSQNVIKPIALIESIGYRCLYVLCLRLKDRGKNRWIIWCYALNMLALRYKKRGCIHLRIHPLYRELSLLFLALKLKSLLQLINLRT